MDSNELLAELAIMLAERHAVERALRTENQQLKNALAEAQRGGDAFESGPAATIEK